MNRKKYFQFKYLIPAFLFLVACATVPLTGRKQFTAIPSSQMVSLGQQTYQQVLNQEQRSDNRAQVQMVQNVGTSLAASVEKYLRENNLEERVEGFEWQFSLLESDAKNAWCLPGGKIAFYEGIMPICEDAEGVAVVMSHEIAHAIADHGNERMSQQLMIQLGGVALNEALRNQTETTYQLAMAAFGLGAQVGVILPYSRKHELEADELGLYFMAMAGYDPREAPKFWQRMQEESKNYPPVFLATHPHPDQRIKKLRKAMPEAVEIYMAARN